MAPTHVAVYFESSGFFFLLSVVPSCIEARAFVCAKPESILNKAGYVRSVRGAQGGYMLKMEPQNYTVGMILRQTEGSLAPVACIEDDEIVCDRQQQCVTSIVYKKINDAISGVVDNITLQDLVDWQNEKNGNYVI